MTTLKTEILLNRRTIIFILFLAALGVRLIALKQNYVIANDSILYIKMAQLYSTGQYHHELFRNYPYYAFFPFLILPFQKVFGNWVLAGQWLSTLCGALTVIPLYFLAKQIFDEKIALLGAVFYIICPDLVQYSAEVLRDIPFVFFYTTALWLGYKGIKDERVVFIGLAGLFIALSACIRIEGLTLLISLPFFLLWYGIKNDIPWKRGLTACGVLLVIVFFIFILFGFLLAQKGIKVSGAQISKGEGVLYSIENKMIKNLEKEIEEKSISELGKEFFYLAKRHRFVLYSHHIFYKTVKVFNILFLLFLFGLIKRREIRYCQDEFLLFAIYATIVPVFLFYLNNSNYLSTRHPFPMVVPSLIWCGVGFVEFKERIIRWMKPRDFPLKDYVVRWLTPLLLIVICVPLLAMAGAPHRKDKLELKEIGLWLKNNGYAHSIIVGQNEFSRLAFYADGEFIRLPEGSYEDIILFAKEKSAALIIINITTIDHLSPDFLEEISHGGLQIIDIAGIKTPKYATTVFLIKGAGERQ